MAEVRILLGNEAIGRGIVEAGCDVVASYPGTPSSEIIPAVLEFKKELGLNTYIEWSANEKVAYDQALAAAMTGKRGAVCMKQVGLNVASDSLMSSAYTGVIGGLVIISCDDPGPHSSQTEQDSRFYAMFAKVPCYDPSTPQEAKEMVKSAFELSEEYEIPVLLRSTIRVSHAKQSVKLSEVGAYGHTPLPRKANFKKDPNRWAATPRYRLDLHQKLNAKLSKIQERFEQETRWNWAVETHGSFGIITCSASFVALIDIIDIIEELKVGIRDAVSILKIGTPYPLPQKKIKDFISRHEKVLVIEEPDAVIESQIIDKSRVLGRFTGDVPLEGELTPEVIYDILARVFSELSIAKLKPSTRDTACGLHTLINELDLPVRKPTLCPGCPERAAFFAIRKAFPKAIYTSDIGCYTLGLNLKAVDTVIDMGAGITLASGFYQAYHQDNHDIPIIATIGDSTFYHAGTAALLSAVYNNARFILVILDNEITAMTGFQPTPGLGITATGSLGKKVSLVELVKGCGVKWVKTIDPYEVGEFIKLLKQARKYTQQEDGGIAVVIANHPCLIRYPEVKKKKPIKVEITDNCNGCGYCIEFFECPALKIVEKSRLSSTESVGQTANQQPKTERIVEIDRNLCVDCGVCINVCAKGAIVACGDRVACGDKVESAKIKKL